MQTDDPQVVATRCSDQLPRLDIGFAWALKGRQLAVVNILKEVPTGFPPTGNVKATPACIIPAGLTKPLKIFTSGWKSRSVSELLDNERWTGLVREFAKAVGFVIPRSIRDTPNSKVSLPENDGRYAACHAENKLSLYFLNLQIRHAGITIKDALGGKLREVKLPLHRRRARIYLGHRPCKNCRNFLMFIRQRTGIDVRWSKCPLFNEHKRDRTFRPGIALAPTRNPAAITTGAKTALARDLEDDTESEAEAPAQQQQHRSRDVNDADDANADADDDAILESVEVDDNLDDLEKIIETLPVGNVTRLRKQRTPGEARECRENKKETATGDRDRAAMPPPALNNTSRISVRSSPSPSISMASVADSTIADRRMRYPTYSSPSRREDSVAPPSVWGGRSKPPVTACLEPPDDFWGAVGDDNEMVTPSQPKYGQSYFFGTPSVTSTQPLIEETGGGFAMVDAGTPRETSIPPGSHIPESMLQIRQAMRAGQSSIDNTASERRDRSWLLRNQSMQYSATPPSSPCTRAEHVHRKRNRLVDGQQQQRQRQRQRQEQRQEQRQSRLQALAGNRSRIVDAAPPAPIYIPPYLRKLQRPADNYRNNGGATTNPNVARSPTPVVDLTDTITRNDDDVEFLASSPAASNPWHPPMRPVRSAEPDVQIVGSSIAGRPRGQPAQRARRRGVAIPVRRQRGRGRNRFPDLRSYHYTGEPEGV